MHATRVSTLKFNHSSFGPEIPMQQSQSSSCGLVNSWKEKIRQGWILSSFSIDSTSNRSLSPRDSKAEEL